MKSRILTEASDFDTQGLDNYGTPILVVYDTDILNDGNHAAIQDCQNQSSYGSLYVESGKKRTVGVDHNHIQAGFVRGDDGIWRVQTVQHVENVPC